MSHLFTGESPVTVVFRPFSMPHCLLRKAGREAEAGAVLRGRARCGRGEGVPRPSAAYTAESTLSAS
jgi:hypothetical protein